MSEIHPNWTKLSEVGVEGVSSINGSNVEISNLSKEIAVALCHAYIQSLEELDDHRLYRSYSQERVAHEIDQRIQAGHKVVMGELRPANRNCAVRMEHDNDGMFSLHADVRNDYEDHPELNGRKKMQQKLIEAIESLGLDR
jgi:hypothetical protein